MGFFIEIVTGVSKTAFAPDDPVTREQLATFLYNMRHIKGLTQSRQTL